MNCGKRKILIIICFQYHFTKIPTDVTFSTWRIHIKSDPVNIQIDNQSVHVFSNFKQEGIFQSCEWFLSCIKSILTKGYFLVQCMSCHIANWRSFLYPLIKGNSCIMANLGIQSGRYQRNVLKYVLNLLEFHQEVPSGNLHLMFQTTECKHEKITLAYTNRCISISSI